jgi:citrate lyase gamma subunit
VQGILPPSDNSIAVNNNNNNNNNNNINLYSLLLQFQFGENIKLHLRNSLPEE